MEIRTEVLLTILGMALVTYATRASGFWLIGRITLSRRLETWLRYVPGCVLVSIVAPGVLSGGWLTILAGIVTIVAAARTKSLPLAMVAGVASLLLLRLLTGQL